MSKSFIALRRSYATHVKIPLLLPTTPPDAPPPAPQSITSTEPSSSSSSTHSPSTSSPSPSPLTPSTSYSSTLPKPRLDYTTLLADPAKTTSNHLARKSPTPYGSDTVAHLKRLRETQLLLLQKLENVRAKQKDISVTIKNHLIDREEGVRQAKKLKKRAGDYEANLSETETELLDVALVLPNFTSERTPVGPESNAIEIDRFGPDPLLEDKKRDHLDIATYWNLIDNEASTTVTGSSWPYLKGTLAMLEQALVNYALSIAVKHGYNPVSPPDVIKQDIAWRCGFQPRDDANSQIYTIQTPAGSPELCLAGTAEIPLAGLFANRILDGARLPERVVGIGKAFRAEAGARGSDTRGLYRVHQFTKVELFTVAEGDEAKGNAEMERMRGVQKDIATGLGLSVRVLEMPTEELGASALRKWDMEAWMPGRGKWGEITSTSNCTDYQSRRLHIRYKPRLPSPGSLPFAHTLNGTAAAIPRLLVALLENGTVFDEAGKPVALSLPRGLERFWVGSATVGEVNRQGEIKWV